jgi:two-component system sensor histidine kinase KdpD
VTTIDEPIGTALAHVDGQLGAREVRVAVAPDLPLVLLDPILVEQMLVNLLENAVKYGGRSPIEVRADRRGDAVVVEVADHGPGIPSGSEERIFEKFYRGAQGGRAGGVGLGLAICRAVATAHDAAITAANAPGGGAVFRVAFPVGSPPPPPPEAPELVEEPMP